MLDVKQMDMEILVATIERLEQAYRAGTPEVSDAEFDHVFLAELQRRDSTHPLLDRVGAEGDFGLFPNCIQRLKVVRIVIGFGQKRGALGG